MAKMNWADHNRRERLQQSATREEQYEAGLHNERQGHDLQGESEVAIALWRYTGTDPVLTELKQQSLATGGKLTIRQIKAGRIALETFRADVGENLANKPTESHRAPRQHRSGNSLPARRELLAKLGLDQEAEQLTKLLHRYTGTDSFLVSIRQQAERGGAGWLPSPAQINCLKGARLSTELSLQAWARDATADRDTKGSALSR